MKMSEERHSMTAALVYYSRIGIKGCKTPFQIYRRIEGACGKNEEFAKDIWAVHECLQVLTALSDVDTLKTIKEIYFKPFSKAPNRLPMKNEITNRIQRFAFEEHVDERTVYRRLQKARKIWKYIRFADEENE